MKDCEFHVNNPKNDLCINYIEAEPGTPGNCKLPAYFLCIDDLHHILPTISVSSRKNFIRCRQLWYFNYIKGIKVKQTKMSESIKLGSLFGYFIQSRYTKGNIIPETPKMGEDKVFANKPFKKVFWDLCNHYQLDEYSAHKLYAICKASAVLKLNFYKDGFVGIEKEFHVYDPNAIIHGFIDVAYEDHFIEVKFGKNPDYYHKIHNMVLQLSTYFMSNEDYEYCIVQAVKVPQLKQKRETLQVPAGEPPEAYGKRMYEAIISKPSEYFPGYNRETGMFGKKFFRSEFPLEQQQKDFIKINKDIATAISDDSFYQSHMCFSPGPCDFLPICDHGAMSDEIFEHKNKPEEDKLKED